MGDIPRILRRYSARSSIEIVVAALEVDLHVTITGMTFFLRRGALWQKSISTGSEEKSSLTYEELRRLSKELTLEEVFELCVEIVKARHNTKSGKMSVE